MLSVSACAICLPGPYHTIVVKGEFSSVLISAARSPASNFLTSLCPCGWKQVGERESVVYDTVAFTVERDLIVRTDAPRVFQHFTSVGVRYTLGMLGVEHICLTCLIFISETPLAFNTM